MATKSPPADLSKSAEAALRWAWAAAAVRHHALPATSPSPSPPALSVEPDDVLVGVLLAHPDERGEGRVLLQHFGLTARDVLPESYPRLTTADLERQAAEIDPAADPPLGSETSLALELAGRLGKGHAAVRHLLGALFQTEHPFRWTPALASRGAEWPRVRDSYLRWVSETLAPDVVAGDSLAEWLVRESPRTPVDLAVYAPDEVNAERDLIGVETEADAFAYLIASCDLTPPLAIGLFGDWGSGKSFLMNAIEQRLSSLTGLVKDQTQADVRVWKRIVRIRFNAWEYVQDNLWAALLERIFGNLGSLRPQLVQSWRAPVETKLAAVQQTVAAAEDRRQATAETRPALQKQVDDAASALENAQAAAKARRYEARDRKAREVAHRALKGLWGALPVLLLTKKEGTDLVVALREARAEVARGHAVLGSYWRRPLHVLLITLGALLVPLVSLLLARADAPTVVSLLGGLAAAVPVVTTTLGAATRWTGRWLTGLEAAESEVEAALQAPVHEAEKKLADARTALAEADTRLQTAQRERDEALARQRELETALERLTPGRILEEFADQRSTEYGQRLGLLAAVRRDLGALETTISTNNDALRGGFRSVRDGARPAPDVLPPAPSVDGPPVTDADADLTATGDIGQRPDVPNRIVLYIDDLDRCPPAKVVEVLEAVHLLLSFRMFVVVVAVDSRWLTSALTDRLVALRPSSTSSQATPHDYLEKIFQLPFWVQPLPTAGRARLVHGLLSDSVRGPDGPAAPEHPRRAVGGLRVGPRESELAEAMLARHGTEVRLDTSPLVLDRGDLDFFESLAPLLGDTPRRVKRFVNTCQLLFALAPPLRPGGPFPSPRAVVSLVAAIGESLPCLTAVLFAELEAIAAGGAAPSPALRARGGVKLKDFLTSAAIDDARRRDYERERTLVTEWLTAHPAWQQVPLAQLALRLDMIRRLRFDKPDGHPVSGGMS